MGIGVFLTSNANAIPQPDHVVIVIEENHSIYEIIGSSSAPYINSLATEGALFTMSYGVSHPSQGNYLALSNGIEQVVNDTCPPPGSPYSDPNLASELLAEGLTFGGYSQSLDAVGSTTCKNADSEGHYARKHNPWVDFSNVPDSVNMPFVGFFPTDYTTLPTVSIVVPNLQHDMHNGTDPARIVAGDNWLESNLDAYKQWAQTHNSLLIVTWDEAVAPDGNHIPTIFVGPMVAPGQYNEIINHYNVLRTIEDMYGLPYAGASASATPITDAWQPTPTPTPTPTATATPTPTPFPPSIVTQPADTTVRAGQRARFSVTATGTPPLHYQWTKNGVNITGATKASYTTPPTTPADNGALFAVTVSNRAGSVTSNNAVLTVR